MTNERPLLREFLADNNLTPRQLADHLAAKGVRTKRGTPVTAKLISGYSSQYIQVPQTWWDALDGVRLDEPVWSDPDSEEEQRRETPPRRPQEAKITLPEVTGGGKKRIAGAYKFAGAALAAGSGCEGVAIVWGDQSDAIADLWIQAAEDNPWAARFVNVMQAGGTVGDLAAAHLYMIGATLYVLGAGIPGGDAIWPKYTKHRIVTVRPQSDVSGNGAGLQPEEESPEGQPAAESPLANG
jgi:hypothetical protein